jgi:tetratricopeptide (TPR) repeat protein
MPGTLPHSLPSAERASQRRANAWRAIAVCGFLVAAVLLVFSRTLSQGFLNYDDDLYIGSEPHVLGGLTWSGLAWAFTSGPAGEWYPLSMLSHMLDCQLYGLHPAGHHLTNLLLHAASAVALFLVLWRMTGGLWPSAMVAALFAVHPLHVESVAWMAERRDVLSGLLFMLTLGAYDAYVRHPRSLGRYLAVVGLFALGLMAKPVLVTLPPLLLLLDFWPLGRFHQTQPEAVERNGRPAPFPWRVVVDKLPLFVLAIATVVVTRWTHAKPLRDPLALPERLANAAVSCVAYLGQLFVPAGLSIFYPHPEAGRPAWQVAAAVVLLLAITAAAVIWRRAYPYCFVGWFWYVGMLVPVLGLTAVGPHARADRYTYLSQIGLYIALVWGAMRLGASWPARRWVFSIGSALLLAALMACTWRQTGFWQDSKTLWEHALACDPKNVTAHYTLGMALRDTDERGAVLQFRQALEIGPNERNIYRRIRAKTHSVLASIAARKGDIAGAIAHYEQALEIDSEFVPAHMNWGCLLAEQGKLDEAVVQFRQSVELAPDSAPDAYYNLALALSRQGKNDEAMANLRKAVQVEPNLVFAHIKLAALLAERDDVDEAILHFRRAIEIEPDTALPYQQIAQLLRKKGKTVEAAGYDERGRKASRRYAQASNLRGAELAKQGKIREAIAQFQAAIAAAPDDAQAHNNLADALALQGNIDDAITHYRRTLEIDPNFAPAKQHLKQLLSP